MRRSTPPVAWTPRTLVVEGSRTHVLEAGDPDAPTVVLIHYGGYGATAEEAWEHTIPAFSEHFHVLAPEQLGFGSSAKVFDFGDPLGARIRNIAAVLELFGVETAHFVGVSTAGTMMLSVAAAERPAWPIDRIIGISAAGGRAGGPDVRTVLQAFDGSFETMDGVIGTLYPERWWDDTYVERRLAAVREPGTWQCVAAEGLRAPWEPDGPSPLASDDYVAYERIDVPVLLVAGAADKLRTLEDFHDRAGRIPNCSKMVFEGAGHAPHIQCAEEFNALALEFLKG
jgi:pimeloyl-ACP methyl ester carboxylesterase